MRLTGTAAISGGVTTAPDDLLTIRPWDRDNLAHVEARNSADHAREIANRKAYIDAAQGKGTKPAAPKTPRRGTPRPRNPTGPTQANRERYQQWRARYEAGESTREIGDSLGIPHGTIRHGLAAIGTVMRPAAQPRNIAPDIAAQIIEAYKAGDRIGTIGRRLHVGNEKVAEIVRAAGIIRVPVHTRGAAPLDVAEITRLYASGLTVREVAKRYGACTKRVAAVVSAAGIMRGARGVK